MKSVSDQYGQLIDWLTENGETVTSVRGVYGKEDYIIRTDKHDYYWDSIYNKLYLQFNDEYEPVLYPNRAIETTLF